MKKNSPKTTQEKPTRSEEHSLSVRTVLDKRKERYGVYVAVCQTSQGIKDAMQSNHGWLNRLSHSQRESLDMIANKIARIVNGDPNYVDSWRDIAGYAQLIVDQLEQEIK